MSDSTQAPPLTCARCGMEMKRSAGSAPQGKAMCHPCRRERNGLPPDRRVRLDGDGPKRVPCSICGKTMVRNKATSLPAGLATCLECRRARAIQRKAFRRSIPKKRVCPMCHRTFEDSRRTYCSPFCRTVGSHVNGFRSFVRMEGEYRQARWWIRSPVDDRYTIGPPRILLDVWVTPSGEPRCPDCAGAMTDLGAMGHECGWCGIRVIRLPTEANHDRHEGTPR